MVLLNALQNGITYSQEALEKEKELQKEKELLLNLFPLVSRHPIEDEKEWLQRLRSFPDYLGGFGKTS